MQTFLLRLAELFSPLGFEARRGGATLVRRPRKAITHRIDVGSSHRNAPGSVAADIVLEYDDTRVAKVEPGWRAGGPLHSLFGEALRVNVAERAQADSLVEVLRTHVAFFDLLDRPDALAAEVKRRYVPGIPHPTKVVPFLAVHLGSDAAAAYGRDLLAARPELGSGFLRDAAGDRNQPDDGGGLAQMLARHAPDAGLVVAPRTLAARSREDAFRRQALGLRLRAWGEPDAAAAIRTLATDALDPLEALPPLVDDPARVAAVLSLLGEHRAPRRSAPSPRLFQYPVLHPSFDAW